jgi:dTDP-glucose 4,6-dehydratase
VRLLVCGGAGFLGSTFVRLRMREHGDEITVLDKLTYAGRRENLADVSEQIRFVPGAIEDPDAVADAADGCDAIVNFAAETHVDRAISAAGEFITTNMQGTHVLLEAARARRLRYLQVSTDEVYGSIVSGSFSETVRAAALVASQRDQGGRGPAGRKLCPHLGPRRRHLPRV